MKERPILFTGAMVRAIIEGRKTQTRRLVKFNAAGRVKEVGSPRNWHIDDPDAVCACPYGVPGDRLYVREQTWKHKETGEYRHADGASDASWRETGWKKVPGIHMPAHMRRILLEIVSVRVERVSEISMADVRAEGCKCPEHDFPGGFCVSRCNSLLNEYACLWDSIHGPGSFVLGDWVWVVEFKRLDSPGARLVASLARFRDTLQRGEQVGAAFKVTTLEKPR